MILAGDIGGTKTLLGLFEPAPERPRLVEFRAFATLEHSSLAEMIAAFTAPLNVDRFEAAAFGVAGPIVRQRAQLTNVPWGVDARDVASHLQVGPLVLLNDLEAMAMAVPVLRPDELDVLQAGTPVADGNAAIIAAGTGLGQATLRRLDGRLVAVPSEAGHADYAPRTKRDLAFFDALVAQYGRAEWEQVLSGKGLIHMHRLLHRGACAAEIDATAVARAPALISAAALEGRCSQCVEALEMFVENYGSEAGNLALRAVATAGLFIGGGIAPKILSALKTPRFLDAFRAKPPMTEFLTRIPVAVILDDRAALVGAAVHASQRRDRP